MNSREKIKQQIDSLNEQELEKVSERIASLKVKSSAKHYTFINGILEGNEIRQISGTLLMTEAVLPDTNILVYLKDQSSAYHHAYLHSIENVATEIFVSSKNTEYVSATTRGEPSLFFV